MSILWTSKTTDTLGNTVNTEYTHNTLVSYDGMQYKAVVDHTASTFFVSDFLLGRWVRQSKKSLSRWLPNTIYYVGDVIKYEQISFTCKFGHESSAIFRNDLLEWSPLTGLSMVYRNSDYSNALYFSDASFVANTLVVHRGIVYNCKQDHNSIMSTGAAFNDTTPGLGSLWEDYWEVVVTAVPTSNMKRWTTGKAWTKNTIAQIGSRFYVCIDPYNSTNDNLAIDNYEPGVGSLYRDRWESFTLWELVDNRAGFIPGWMEDIPYIRDYVEASAETFLTHVDFPLTQLKNLRNISVETSPEILKNSIESQGFTLAAFSANLVSPDSLYPYITYFNQYAEESGTNYYLDFMNFIISPPKYTDPLVLPQYTISDVTKAKWVMTELYTNNYRAFWTQKELEIIYLMSRDYVYEGNWKNIKHYRLGESVQYKGWIWTSNIVDNINSEPTRTNPDWVLSCLIPGEFEIIRGVYVTSPKYKSNVLHLNAEMEMVDIYPVPTPITFPYKEPPKPGDYLGVKGIVEYEAGTSKESKWTIYSQLATTFEDAAFLYLNDYTGPGFYLSANVYLHREDRADYIGLDLEKAKTLIFKGTWASTTTYDIYDVVYYQSSYYVLLQDSTDTPGTTLSWRLCDTSDIEEIGGVATIGVYPEWRGIHKIYYEFAPANQQIYVKDVGPDFIFNTLKIIEIGLDKSETEECGYVPFICSDNTIKYPIPARIGNWVAPNLGDCVTCPQKLFVPTLKV